MKRETNAQQIETPHRRKNPFKSQERKKLIQEHLSLPTEISKVFDVFSVNLKAPKEIRKGVANIHCSLEKNYSKFGSTFKKIIRIQKG